MNTTSVDWAIVFVVLLSIVLVSIYCRRYVKGVSDFVVAGRCVRKYLALSTGLAESIGIITFARVMQQGFLHGPSYAWIDIIDMLIVALVFGYFGVVVVRYRRGGFMTVAQFFESRYDKRVRIVAGFATSIAGVLNFAVFPIIASSFLTHFMGVPERIELVGVSFLTIPTLMGFLILLGLTFTNLGGMIAVLVTGYLQSIVLSLGMFIVVFISVKHVGITNLMEGVRQSLGSAAFNPLEAESYGPVFLLWIGFNVFFCYIAFSPTMQKIASADSEKTAQTMTFIGSFFNKGRTLMMMIAGICALVAMGPTPPGNMEVSLEQWSRIAGPMFLGSIMPPVAMGIVLACFLTAFLSTVSMYLLSWSSVIINDIVCVLKRNPMTHRGHLFALKITLLSIALFLFIFGIMYQPTESILEYIFLTGTMFTGIGIALVFGLYWKGATASGALAAIICSAFLPFLDLICRRISFLNYNLPPEYSGLGSILFSVFMCIVFSALAKKSATGVVH